MQDNLNEQKSQEEKEKEILERKRIRDIERHKRFRKRRKLKNAVADFTNRLQHYKGIRLSKGELISINTSLGLILRLPYRWTEKDLQRAWNRLKKLEKKFLDRNYEDVLGDNRSMLENFHNTMTAANLDTKTRVEIALELLTAETEELFLHNGDTVEPSSQMALCFLTQDMDYTVPEWFNKELLNLLYEKYKGTDFNKFMTTIRSKLQIRRMTENMKNLNKEIMEEELEE